MRDKLREVTVWLGNNREVKVEVPKNATGYEIKRAVHLAGLGLPDEILSWQLQARLANGANRIVGNMDRPMHSYFDLMTIYDNA